jgi:hypothetical protein
MGRTKTIGVVAGLVLLATGLLGAGAARGETAIHVLWPTKSIKAELDFGPKGPSMGDRIAARGPLVDPGDRSKKVGRAYVDCLVVKSFAGGHGLFDCSYVLQLEGGTLTLTGIDPPGPSVVEFAVTGGSGDYRDARGDAVLTDFSKGTDMMITLVD